MIFIFLRKLRSLYSRLFSIISTAWCYFYSLGNKSIVISSGCTFGRGVLLKATDGGTIVLGSGVSLADRVQIIAQGGRIVVGCDVFIGLGTIITSMECVVIGNDSQIAEYVVIRDQDHRIDTRPIRTSGFNKAPIQVGSDVWIGAKASVLRGASIGDRCVIGAHALVRSCIPADSLAVGVPARVIKQKMSR